MLAFFRVFLGHFAIVSGLSALVAGCRAERTIFVFQPGDSVKPDSLNKGVARVVANETKQQGFDAFPEKAPVRLKNPALGRSQNEPHTQVRASSFFRSASIRPSPKRWLLRAPPRRHRAPSGYDGKGLAEAFYTALLAFVFLMVAVVGLLVSSPAALLTGAIGLAVVILLYALGITNDLPFLN